MPAGLGGSGWLAITLETVMGTYLPPSTAGTLWVPIISESLHYEEDRYLSPQIRQSTVMSDAKPGYYHVEGDVVLEADANFLPYFAHCSRFAIAKSGAGPYVYDYTPSQAGSASTAASGNVARTCSLTVVRNGLGFGYAGCTMGTWEFTLDNGVLRCSLGVMGLSEQLPGALGTPAWISSGLFGADAHSVYVAAAAATPTFGAADLTFNGFTSNINFNAAPQNRINANRSASYISFGETEATYNTELDFTSRTEYDNFKATTRRAVRFESVRGGATFTLATEAVRLDFNNSIYESYDVGLGGLGDLIMATTTGRALGIAGGAPIQLSIKSAANIA